MKFPRLIAIALAVLPALCARATDRFFSDFTNRSTGGRYELRAESPDNRKSGHHAFQASFVYTFRDTKTGATLWTRKQPMDPPKRPDKKSSYASPPWPKEGSPVHAYISESGWTAVWTDWDELIIVDVAGRDRGMINLLREAITEEENKRFVHFTTAGPNWAGMSLWYFLDIGDEQLFVIRPWWGRHIVIDVPVCRLRKETKAISQAIAASERNELLSALAKGVATRAEWDKRGECCEAVWPVERAAYLAGCIKLTEAVPFLVKLEDCNYSGSSTSGGLSMMEKFDGEVDPHGYSTFSLRQVIQLSLRRLGKAPQRLPANSFDVRYEDYKKRHPYKGKPLAGPRHLNAGQIAKGMKAEQVLDLVGCPDFVGYETWEYDMDATPPFTLILKWDVRHVIGIETKIPACWQDGFIRDEQIIH